MDSMQMISTLSTVILAATLVTIVFAAFSYLAYRARERKVPGAATASTDKAQILLEPQFFKRYRHPD